MVSNAVDATQKLRTLAQKGDFKGEVGDHTTSNAYSGGQIKGYQKGRSAGDCWTGKLYTWDGKTFAKTEDYFTGQCGKEFPGGAWMLYEYTSDTTTP